jgi:magnesium transporter
MSGYRRKNKVRRLLELQPRFIRARRTDVHRIGLPPGTLLPNAELKPSNYELFSYNPKGYTETSGTGVPDISQLFDPGTVSWLNIVGVEDKEVLEYLGEKLRIHPVILEDIQNTVQRPKIEHIGDYLYCTLRMLRWNDESSQIISEQLSILITEHFVLSFQEMPGDVFDEIRSRIRQKKGRVRTEQADYLGYVLLDMVVDTYFLIVERLEELTEDIEEALLEGSVHDHMTHMQGLRKMLIAVRRAVWPLQEVLNGLQKLEYPHIRPSTYIYFRDLSDHVLRIIDTLELMREATASLADSYQSTLSNEMNRVMKVLTIIATIFIPLTFIAGIYGMNFQHMPELSLPWAYPAILVLMGTLGAGMLIYFKVKKWL